MPVDTPADCLRRSQFWTTVTANAPLCREHFRLVLRCDREFPATQPGQFVQILCRDENDASAGAFLRRPFSLAGRRDLHGGATEIDIIHRVVGMGTAWMSRLRIGDQVNILGPLGNRFALPDEDQLAILVGGGVGIPPMLYLADALARAGRNAVAICGATTVELLPLTVIAKPATGGDEPALCIEEFARHDVPSIISTDDGSIGLKGFTTEALERFLDPNNRKSQHPHAGIRNRKSIFTCGPELMMKRVAQIGAEHSIPVQVAVERAMACGMGTCQSCCIRVTVPREIDPDGWRYKLACTDGPIFAGTDLLW